MRVKPSVPVGIALAVGYTALFSIMFKLSGVDYDEIADTADNALKAVVIPLVVAAGALIIVTTLLGWWKSTLRDPHRARGWIMAVPIVMLTATIAGINYGGLGDIDSKLLLWIAVGTLLVGFAEELMYRGLVLVSFRGAMPESHAWFWSSVAFGLLHGANFFLGQDLFPTIQQVGFAFVLGSGLYIARRASGAIFLPDADARPLGLLFVHQRRVLPRRHVPDDLAPCHRGRSGRRPARTVRVEPDRAGSGGCGARSSRPVGARCRCPRRPGGRRCPGGRVRVRAVVHRAGRDHRRRSLPLGTR